MKKANKKRFFESEKIEVKSKFEGRNEEWFKLIKTIMALANTKGGEIKLFNISNLFFKDFDSARIDDKVNKYVEPRIQNIQTKILKNSLIIIVPNSLSKPHIFSQDGRYENPAPPPQQRTEFYKGQIWVRHSAKNELATKDDFERIFQEKLKEFTKRINLISQFPLDTELKIEPESPKAIPIKIVKNGKGLPAIVKKEKTDPNKDYPYFTKDVAAKLGKSIGFVAAATKKLGLKENKELCIQIQLSGKGKLPKYNEKVYLYLVDFLSKNPTFNPFK